MKKRSRKGTGKAPKRRGQRKHDWPALLVAFLATPHGDLTRFAQEHGIPPKTVFERSSAEGWRYRWEAVQKQALEQALAATVEDRAKQLEAMNTEHHAVAGLAIQGVTAYLQTQPRDGGGRILLCPDDAQKAANALAKLQAVQRIAAGVPTEKQGREVSGPDGAPVPVQMQTLTIHVDQARPSPEPPEAPDDPDDRDDS